MARYLDENGLALLINNYLKPEDEYSLSSEHPVQNKVLTQTFGNLLSIIDYSKVTGYFHYANAAALPTVNSTGQEEGDFEYNPEKELKIGQRAILDDTQAVMEISAIDSSTGAITWTNTGLSFAGQVIQVDELPTASAAEEDKIYQYVGDTDALTGVTNGYFYKCVSDDAVSPSYSWENIKVSEGDTIQVETLPTAGASEIGNIYQYVGETNLSFTNGYFYECIEDSGSYNWVEKEVQKSDSTPHWSGTRAEYEAQKDSIEDGTYVSILDDIDTHELVDVVEEDNMNPVTSNAVAEAISQIKTETKARYKLLSFNSIPGVTFARRDGNLKALSATRVDNIIVLNYSITVQGTYNGTTSWLPIFNPSQLDSLLDDDEVLNDSVTPYFCSGITYTNDASHNKLDGVMNGYYLYFYNTAVFNMGIQGQIILGVQKTS